MRTVIICEDTQQECFARRFLYGMGWKNQHLRIVKSPSAKGSAEQWVKDRYVNELGYYHKTQITYAIIAIVDGDTIGVEGRIKQFEKTCIERGTQIRSDSAAVAIIVPTRNIETWIHYLQGKQVDETTVYPKLKYESECQPAVQKLLDLCKTTGLPTNAPNSLNAACAEYRTRILSG